VSEQAGLETPLYAVNGQRRLSMRDLLAGQQALISQKLVPRLDGQGRVVAMEILNNNYAVSNLIRLLKLEQIYSQLQSRTRDIPEERMLTLERSLALLVRQKLVTPAEAQKWANHSAAFLDELQRAE